MKVDKLELLLATVILWVITVLPMVSIWVVYCLLSQTNPIIASVLTFGIFAITIISTVGLNNSIDFESDD